MARLAATPVSRKHVAILAANFWPERVGSGQVTTEFATYLASRGIRVKVAAAMPYYPQWRIWPAYRGRVFSREAWGGVEIHRCWHWVSPSPSTLGRLLHEWTLAATAVPALVRVLVGAREAYVVSPPLSFALVAVLLARLLGVRCTLVVNDLMPEAAIELGMLTNPVAVALSRVVAKLAYVMAREIHTLSDGMRERIVRRGTVRAKVRVVPVTIDPLELFPVPQERNRFRELFASEGDFVVVHSGNMGHKQDLPLLLRTARALLGHSRIRFVVFGDGAERERFLATCDAWHLSNVSHRPLQDRGLLPDILSGADVVLVSQLPQVVDIVVPSKLITAMAAGAMVVVSATRESEAARLVARSGGGIAIPPSDSEALAEVLRNIAGGEVDTAACRSKARAYVVSHYDRDAVYGPIAARLGDIVKRA